MSGIGSNPITITDEKKESSQTINNFDKVENSVLRFIELYPNIKDKLKYWNRTVHLWLKYNVCLRLLGTKNRFLSNKTMANFLTFVVSSIWHGFYPGYYFGFIQCYFLEQFVGAIEAKGYSQVIEKNLVLGIVSK
jgi:D-alanyl-lipoteichoic acid acyltransferase DltB (MBOAT superfamily)